MEGRTMTHGPVDPARVIIREARPDDAEVMIAFVNTLAAERDIDILLMPGDFTLTVEEEAQTLAGYAAADNSLFLVAEIDGTIAGNLNCSGGKRQGTRHTATLGTSVVREWRGRGIGTLLMARAIDWARASGVVRRIELQVFARNARAIHLYEKFGFIVEGRHRQAVYRYGEYIDILTMALLLE
ncbi:MAG: GNAT family N-acetyltransferase [Anaerolineae bacterium]|nr:GNAT family N-acetyltransferase [Anaerolineae bacterium]